MSDGAKVQQELNAELDSGERLQWQGRPKPRFFALSVMLPTLLIFLWLGFMSAFFFGGNHPLPFNLIPVALLVLIFTGMPMLWYFSPNKAYYFLTNRRVIIISLGTTRKVASY